MWTDLHWVEGPWPGKLALAARPRGGEWLRDELGNWRLEGVHTVFSLLTPEEEQDLDLIHEKRETQAQGMTFISFPIPDRQVPDSETAWAARQAKLRAWRVDPRFAPYAAVIDQMLTVDFDSFQRLAAVRNIEDFVLILQDHAERLPETGIVIDDQDERSNSCGAFRRVLLHERFPTRVCCRPRW